MRKSYFTSAPLDVLLKNEDILPDFFKDGSCALGYAGNADIVGLPDKDDPSWIDKYEEQQLNNAWALLERLRKEYPGRHMLIVDFDNHVPW